MKSTSVISYQTKVIPFFWPKYYHNFTTSNCNITNLLPQSLFPYIGIKYLYEEKFLKILHYVSFQEPPIVS